MWAAASFAQSIDGKLATLQNPRIRLGSATDLARLKIRRAGFDAVLVGGRTFAAWPIPYRAEKPIHNLVLSRHALSAHINDPQLWCNANVSLHMLTPKDNYPDTVQWHDASQGIQSVLECCKILGVSRLLIEGGGGLLSEFIKHHPVQELFVTLCPMLLGGLDSPTALDGQSFSIPHDYRLVQLERLNDELYLHYRLSNTLD